MSGRARDVRTWHNPDRPRSPRSGRYRVISGLNAPRERLCSGIVPKRFSRGSPVGIASLAAWYSWQRSRGLPSEFANGYAPPPSAVVLRWPQRQGLRDAWAKMSDSISSALLQRDFPEKRLSEFRSLRPSAENTRRKVTAGRSPTIQLVTSPVRRSNPTE